jgi:FHS family L-fucose permease-like MFS transporter
MKMSDLSILSAPYIAIGLIIIIMLILISVTKMPENGEADKNLNIKETLKRIISIKRYREGVIAEFFYVGAQIMCWTFIIQYGTQILMKEGISEQAAEITSQQYNILAMVIFCCSRFICTYFLKFINECKFLGIMAVIASILTCGVIYFQNRTGLYCLVAVSGCMSLMFPTIYGIALHGLGDDAKLGGAGLIMAILGGSVLPPVQASIIDAQSIWGFPAVNISFVLPLICFLAVIVYGVRTYRKTI